MDYFNQLKRQIDFIQRSCETYDEGFKDEALRIAVSMRVLFHDTSKSKSLLSHLNVKNKIHLISTMSIEKDKFEDEEDFQMIYIPMMLTLQGVKPPLEKSPIKNVLIIDEWLNEIVMAELNPIRRKDIILSAANQDGGAHVDDNPNMNTKILRRGIGTFTITIDGKKKTEILSNHHFPLIRQFAYEVLHSKELTSLIQN